MLLIGLFQVKGGIDEKALAYTIPGLFSLLIKNVEKMNSSDKSKGNKKSSALTTEEEVQKNPDPRIDQDFPGFPHPPSHKKNIKPATEEEKKSAGVKKK
jgi:hypothetical protein